MYINKQLTLYEFMKKNSEIYFKGKRQKKKDKKNLPSRKKILTKKQKSTNQTHEIGKF